MNSGGSPRDRVIDATLRLATRREFSDVTLTDIAQEAGISLADLRELFPSKGAIIGAFSRRVDREVLDALPRTPRTNRRASGSMTSCAVGSMCSNPIARRWRAWGAGRRATRSPPRRSTGKP